MGTVLIGIGSLIVLIGGILFLVAAFQESVLWGVGCLLFSPVSFVFLIMHWNVSKKPFLIQLAGIPFTVLGYALSS